MDCKCTEIEICDLCYEGEEERDNCICKYDENNPYCPECY